ncbi:peptidylprolyl isomerase, partial [Halomonas sp. 707D4]|nr:peptidylprolyl isomerase [Halomonas sp. 707D4]
VAAAQRQRALQDEADRLVAALEAGDEVDVTWLEASDVSRQGPATLPAALIDGVFRLPRPEEGESRFASIAMPGTVSVVALDSVEQGSADDDQLGEFMVQFAEQMRAQAALEGLVKALRDDADIER